MNIATAYFPLVPRSRPPCLPLRERIANLAALTAKAQEATRQNRADRAAAVLNNAALIASDCGIPAMARDLCRRQHEALATSAPLPGWAARLAMQPILNITRQLIREGDGDGAREALVTLHQAALTATATAIEGIPVDFGILTSTTEARREVCTLTWSALLADGTRAFARAGRWKEAAELAAAYRGTGIRLLDGRQAAILALLAGGRASEANQMIDQSAVAEPWEHAVQALLQVLCQRTAGQNPAPGTAVMITAASDLANDGNPETTVTRTRIGLTALHLAGKSGSAHTRALRAVLNTAGNADAYAARDLLADQRMSDSLTPAQRSRLTTLLHDCGLDARTIPARLQDQLMTAADQAESILIMAVAKNVTP
jgi:hypothetical protein